jgi:hypothetical protein
MSMNAERLAWRRPPTGNWGDRALPLVLNAVRMTVYAVLAVLRPFIVIILAATSMVGFGLCLFFGLLAPGTHFPMLMVLTLSVASAVLIVVFYAVMDLLLPR